ncbi:MAG: hypothetical protein A3A30_02675 [Candidatus Terrybacteria bacterium RIFCSPLOWO2_01_FULL_48_14]|nr:MAG: hypothetical protein A3A30_02675 [Candidatus Terrybacteria bacterium RIFCSPLOWO2_01_FULL_48_14]
MRQFTLFFKGCQRFKPAGNGPGEGSRFFKPKERFFVGNMDLPVDQGAVQTFAGEDSPLLLGRSLQELLPCVAGEIQMPLGALQPVRPVLLAPVQETREMPLLL